MSPINSFADKATWATNPSFHNFAQASWSRGTNRRPGLPDSGLPWEVFNFNPLTSFLSFSISLSFLLSHSLLPSLPLLFPFPVFFFKESQMFTWQDSFCKYFSNKGLYIFGLRTGQIIISCLFPSLYFLTKYTQQ